MHRRSPTHRSILQSRRAYLEALEPRLLLSAAPDALFGIDIPATDTYTVDVYQASWQRRAGSITNLTLGVVDPAIPIAVHLASTPAATVAGMTLVATWNVDLATGHDLVRVPSSYYTSGSALLAAPSAPSNLTATVQSASAIALNWVYGEGAGGVAGFRIERQAVGSSLWSVVAAASASATSFIDGTLRAGTQYSYRVSAVSDAGASAASNVASATTAPSQVAAPTGFSATVQSYDTVVLSWTDAANDETGFEVQRMAGGGSWGNLAVLPASTTGFTDTTAAGQTQYSYRVYAFSGPTNSPYSGTQTVTTPSAQAPLAPTLTSATVFSADRIDLSWTDNSNNEQSFVVQESTDGSTFSDVATLGANTTSFSATGLTPATTYYFRVEAQNSAGLASSLALSSQTLANNTVGGDGWTTVVPSADSRIIYVSSSTGNDINSGLSPDQAVATIGKGYSLMRSGYPDWIRLKCGDTWSGSDVTSLNDWRVSGRSATAPIVVTSYGSGARPVIDAPAGGPAVQQFRDASYVDFIGINFYESVHDPSSPNYSSSADASDDEGIRWLGGQSLLIEDCVANFFSLNIDIQSVTNLAIRRSIVTNSWTASGAHSQGAYLASDTTVLLEENTFDHNGWVGTDRNATSYVGLYGTVTGGGPTMFNHDLYIQTNCVNVTLQDNIIANAAADGAELRPGGIAENNLFFGNPVDLFVGNDAANTIPTTINANVMVQTGVLGWGIELYGTITSATVSDNVIANNDSGVSSGDSTPLKVDGADPANPVATGATGVSLTSNVIYNCSGQGITDNGTGTVKSGNVIDGTGYPDPSRTPGSYNATLGGAAIDAAFLGAVENRPAGTWNSSYSAVAVNNYIRAGFGLAAESGTP